MIFIRLIRFILGYVHFSATGGFPERFINLCALNGVPLWDVKNLGGVLHAKTTIKGYKKIRLPARKSGMLPRLSERHGLPFILFRYKMRVGILAGAVAAVLIMSILSTMIWNVSVVGNENISSEEIIEELENLGVSPGALRRKIDSQAVEKAMMKRFEGIIWSSLNIFSSTASFEMRERTTPPEMFSVNDPCNIISAEDGEIIKIEAYVGKAVLAVGSAVKKGDLLISGVIQTKFHNQFVHSKGSIIARSSQEIIAQTPLNLSSKTVSLEKIRNSIYIFGIKIPLGRSFEADEYAKSEKLLESGGNILPIGIIRERYTFFEEGTSTLTNERASLLSMTKFYDDYKNTLSKATIISENISAQNQNNAYVIKGSYKVEQEIGTEQYFETE